MNSVLSAVRAEQQTELTEDCLPRPLVPGWGLNKPVPCKVEKLGANGFFRSLKLRRAHLLTVLTWCVVVASLLPIFWMLLSSLRNYSDIAAGDQLSTEL